MNKDIIKSYQQEVDFDLLMQPYKAAIKIVKTKLEIIDEELKLNCNYSPIHNIQCRIKSPKSILGKMKRKNLKQNYQGMCQLNDIAGLRVICNYINDIQYIAQLLVLHEDVIQIKQANYIQYPKCNGYRSLHLIIKVPVYQKTGVLFIPVEIQIRTIAMDCWASLEHELAYKGAKKTDTNIQRRLKRCADLMAETDAEMQKIYLELNHR